MTYYTFKYEFMGQDSEDPGGEAGADRAGCANANNRSSVPKRDAEQPRWRARLTMIV